jgi:hypothetical protein
MATATTPAITVAPAPALRLAASRSAQTTLTADSAIPDALAAPSTRRSDDFGADARSSEIQQIDHHAKKKEMTMRTTSEIEVRELDRRKNDGLDVRLLWNSHTNRVSVAVEDERSGESFELEIDSADALAAFHHPYAYAQAPPRSLARRLPDESTSTAPQAGPA